MTQRTEQVEPPLNSRSVQIPVAVLLTIMLMCAISLIRNTTTQTDAGVSEALAIDLNSAAARELSLLPGVGPVLAKRIVENRKRLGPFESCEDVGRVYGVGEKTVSQIDRYCTIGGLIASRAGGQAAGVVESASLDRPKR